MNRLHGFNEGYAWVLSSCMKACFSMRFSWLFDSIDQSVTLKNPKFHFHEIALGRDKCRVLRLLSFFMQAGDQIDSMCEFGLMGMG